MTINDRIRIPEEFLEVTGEIEKIWFPRQGYTSEVMIVFGNNGTYAIKKASGERFSHDLSREVMVLNSLQGTGLPIPKVYGLMRTNGHSWALYQHIHGQTLREAFLRSDNCTKQRLIFNFGRILARIHNTTCPANLKRSNMPWLDYMLFEAEKSLLRFKTEGTAERLRELKDTKPEHIDQTLIHGDFTIDNVLVEKGEITGVIDWGDGCLGDPRYDVTLAIRPKVGTFNNQEDVDLFFEGYGKISINEKTADFFGNKGLYAFF